MEFGDLTEGQKRMARAANTHEELVELAKAEGIELSDEQLEEVSGGWTPCSIDSPDARGVPYARL